MDSVVGRVIPPFKAQACANGEFTEVDSAKFKGKWTVLLFYPLDFTFVCPTEIVAYDGAADRFAKLGATVYGVSVDSHFTHRVYLKTSRAEKICRTMRACPSACAMRSRRASAWMTLRLAGDSWRRRASKK